MNDKIFQELEENYQFEQHENDSSCDLNGKKSLLLQELSLSPVLLCLKMLEVYLDVS